MDDYEPFPGLPRDEQLRRLKVRHRLAHRWQKSFDIVYTNEPLEHNDDELDNIPERGTTNTEGGAGWFEATPDADNPRIMAVKALKLPYFKAMAKAGKPLFKYE